MNFFGHACVASWRSSDPAFALGAMLPDFATMIRARPPGSSHRAVTTGIHFHHETDTVFHDAPTFRRLQSDALASLLDRGVRRGGARAVAHVGVEILIDGALAATKTHRDVYLSAIDRAGRGDLAGTIYWATDVERDRFALLRDRLERHGIGPRPAAAAIADRLHRVLSGRRLLELDETDRGHVAEWVDEARAPIEDGTPEVVRELRRGLNL